MTNPMGIDVTAVIDNARFGRAHLRIVLLCAVLILLDGFDLGAISFAAPEFIKLLQIDRAMIGPVFSAGLFGLTLGALLFGLLGDRWGPRRVFVLCGVIFGICTLGTATATTMPTLLAWRFLAGVGLGGASPLSIAIASNVCPRRIRTSVVMVMYVALAVGQVVGGYTYALFTSFGWRSIFYVGGIVPLMLTPAFLLWLPETLPYQVMHNAPAARIRAVLAQLSPGEDFSAETRFTVSQEDRPGFQVALLFRDGRAWLTTVLWAVFFTSIVAIYFYNTWLPTLLRDSGLSQTQIIAITTAIQLGGVFGTLAAAPTVLKLGAFRTVSLGYLCAALAMLVLGSGATSFAFLFSATLAVGFFLIGTQSALNASSANVYPPSLRATGVGWGFGIGRIGSVISPSLAGLLVSLHWSPAELFRIAAAPTLLACLAAWIMLRLLRRTGSSAAA